MMKKTSKTYKEENGFTLIELMTVVAIVGIVATFAIPSLSEMIANARLNSLASDLHSNLAVARSEAVKQGSPVTICSSDDQLTCSGSNNWAKGWIIFTDYSGAYGFKDGADQILYVSQPRSGNVTLTGSMSSARYLPNGTLN